MNPASPMFAAPAAMPPGGGGSSWMDGLLSQYDPKTGMTQQGWGVPALGAAQGIFNAYMGLQHYGLYKDQLAKSKKQFSLNYDAQRQTTNSALQDRQAARVASNPGAYQSVGDYMAQYGIKKG